MPVGDMHRLLSFIEAYCHHAKHEKKYYEIFTPKTLETITLLPTMLACKESLLIA